MDANLLVMDCVIVSPDDTVFEEEVVRVSAPGPFGEVAVLPQHTPIYTRINKGKVVAWLDDKKTKEIEIDGGILRARDNKVTIIVGFDEEE